MLTTVTGITIIVVWLSILTFVVYHMSKKYNHLVKRTRKTNLDEILDVIIKNDEMFDQDIKGLEKAVEKITGDMRFHYQKMGFMRFNPFDRVAGDQSFVISLLDGESNGLLLNFLYTRDGVRIYAKRVKNGTSAEYDLSTEEKEVIKKAT